MGRTLVPPRCLSRPTASPHQGGDSPLGPPYRIAVKRRLTKLAVFLLLGAIVNVTVAWGCAAWVYLGETSSVAADTISDEDATYYRVRRWDRLGAIRVSVLSHPSNYETWTVGNSDMGFLPPWAAFLKDLRRTGDAPFRASFADVRGFPMRSMWCLVDQEIREVNVSKLTSQRPLPNMNINGQFYHIGGATRVVHGIEWGPYTQYGNTMNHYSHELRVLPLGLLWPAFLVNSAFYAVIIWLSLFCLFAPRRAIRRSRRRFLGHCLNCDYDLRGAGHDVCPECGLAVEMAILATHDPRWTKLQMVLCTLAIAQGIVLPIANFTVFQYSLGLGKSWSPQEVLVGFIALWLLGALIWVGALVVGIFNRRFTQTCLLIMVAVLAETVIAVGMNADTWVELW